MFMITQPISAGVLAHFGFSSELSEIANSHRNIVFGEFVYSLDFFEESQ